VSDRPRAQIGTLLVALVHLAWGLFLVAGGVHGVITAPTHWGEGSLWIVVGVLPVIVGLLLTASVIMRSHCLVSAGWCCSVSELWGNGACAVFS